MSFRAKVIKARLEGKSFRMLAKEFGVEQYNCKNMGT
jgi:hypothetical protein